jgi:hypothetical protein
VTPKSSAAPRRTPARATAGRGKGARRIAAPVVVPHAAAVLPALSPEWRAFVGRWLEAGGCTRRDAARGDWEIELSPALRRRWRRQRVRLVFDPQRATLPRGAWFTAPGSGAGRRILEAALEAPVISRRTALAKVPGAPDDGLASVCRVRGLSWGAPRLGPVHYQRRMGFHGVVTRWGGLPLQEYWAILIGPDGRCLESVLGLTLPELRPREGLYQINDVLSAEERERWMGWARDAIDGLVAEREHEWERKITRLRDDELDRLGAFFSARIEEEEERLRRRASHPDDSDLSHGDAMSLKLEWERRAAEVRQRWAIRTEIRLWGLVEWSWPVAELEQEVRAGAMHVKLTSQVDVARGVPALPACPHCSAPAEMLVRSRGTVTCARCA